MLTRHPSTRATDESGFTVTEVAITSAVLIAVLAMFLNTLTSLTRSEDRAQRLVANEQNVRFELDQMAREIRAANPLISLLHASSASAYTGQVQLVLTSDGSADQVVRWTYDTTRMIMVRQVMSSTATNATVVSESFFLNRVRNEDTGTPVFRYFDQAGTDLVAKALADGAYLHDPANCAVRVHIELRSDSQPGPLPFTVTQDVHIRNRLPGNVGCG
ncbi:MAG: hypothetical protein ACKOBG_01545 [Actinomycetota bacterium]